MPTEQGSQTYPSGRTLCPGSPSEKRMLYFFLILAIALAALFLGRRAIFRFLFERLQRHPEYVARMALVERSYAAEETLTEEADWFGTTGLDDDLERELPKYLRRESGELLLEEGSLKASDLKYLGAFEEPDATVHYWLVPSHHGEPTYAYIEIHGSGQSCTGWGGREPPAHASGGGNAA